LNKRKATEESGTIKGKNAVNFHFRDKEKRGTANNKVSAGASDKNKYGDLHDVYLFHWLIVVSFLHLFQTRSRKKNRNQ
jgi:hypothetical protein